MTVCFTTVRGTMTTSTAPNAFRLNFCVMTKSSPGGSPIVRSPRA